MIHCPETDETPVSGLLIYVRVCQKFKTTLYINQTRNLSESHLSCEFSLFLIFKYSEMPPKAFYKAKTDANMV